LGRDGGFRGAGDRGVLVVVNTALLAVWGQLED